MTIGFEAAALVVLIGLMLVRPPRARSAVRAGTIGRGDGPRLLGSSARVGRRVIGLIVAAVLLGPIAAAAVALALLTFRAWRRLRSARASVAAARRQVPDAVDVIVLGIRAGLTPAHAFAELGQTLPAPISAYFAEVTVRQRRGERFADALDALHDAPENMLRPLATALARAERYGEPLAPVLDRLADEARRERRRHAETSARQLPVRMCFPLACCTLPAFVLLTIVPLLAGTFSSIRGNLP